MGLKELQSNLNTHQNLPDDPGVTADELKVLWDQAPNEIKKYINESLTKELDELLAKKVDKVDGKVLSDINFTNDLFNKLDGINPGANKYVHPDTAGNKHIPAGRK